MNEFIQFSKGYPFLGILRLYKDLEFQEIIATLGISEKLFKQV